MLHSSLIDSVKRIALEAGARILDIYNNEANFQVESKADHSPLTMADRESNRIICAGLEQLSPRYPIISEENREIPFAERQHFEYAWLVDPLDGTKEFIHRNGDFTVNIALIKDHALELGVVYIPVWGELYWAIRDQGAFWEKDAQVRPLKAASFRMDDPGLKVVCSRSHMNAETQAFVDKLHAPELVSRGSALKFLLLARGEAHLYPRLGPTMEWDTGAAQVVLEAAGGKVVRADNGEPMLYNKEHLLNPGFIAYGSVQG